jgi:hypothetical protein
VRKERKERTAAAVVQGKKRRFSGVYFSLRGRADCVLGLIYMMRSLQIIPIPSQKCRHSSLSLSAGAAHSGGWVMPRSISFDADAASEEVRAARHRQQDENFRRALLAAVYAGTETCPLSVSTEPGTKKPMLNYQRLD